MRSIPLVNSSFGIGDMVCGLYAAEALKEKYPEKQVDYYVRSPQWLSDAKNIAIKQYAEAPTSAIDLYVNLGDEQALNHIKTRKQLYADRLNYGNITPKKPELTKYHSINNSAIVLSPKSAWGNREWAFVNWQVLEYLLHRAGYNVIVMLPDERYKNIFKAPVCGASSEVVIGVITGAAMVIANDSGMAHLSGMYNVPCLSIFGGYSREFLFSETDITAICSDKLTEITLRMVFDEVVSLMKKYTVYVQDHSIPFTVVGGINKGDGLGKVCYSTAKGLMQQKELQYNTAYFGSADILDGVTQNMIDRNNFKIGKKSLITNWTGGVPYCFYEQSDAYEICMFEAEKELPDNWLTRWNSHCKGLIVPDEWNKENFEKCGVKIPIHVVPLAIETDGVSENLFSDDIFTFGITSQYEERKNHELVIQSFIKKFGASKKHKLLVHGRWGHLYDDLKKKYGHHKNIDITCVIMSDSDMDVWWKTLDCYILCSAGEGFSYTPREAIVRGIPTIVSDCMAHKLLVETGGVYGVKPTGTKPAYKHIWNKVVGVDYTFSVDSLANAMGEVSTYFGEWRERVKLANKYIRTNENLAIVTEKLLNIFK